MGGINPKQNAGTEKIPSITVGRDISKIGLDIRSSISSMVFIILQPKEGEAVDDEAVAAEIIEVHRVDADSEYGCFLFPSVLVDTEERPKSWTENVGGGDDDDEEEEIDDLRSLLGDILLLLLLLVVRFTRTLGIVM